MAKIDELQRLEFLNAYQRLYNSTLARQELQGTKLIEVLFQSSYDLNSSRDIGILLSNLNARIDTDLSPELYRIVTGAIEDLTALGVTHSVAKSTGLLGSEAFNFMDINTRLATDYISRVGEDGLRLSERIWSSEQKKAITEEVFNSIRRGDSKFQLAQNLEKVVGKGVPRSSLERIAKSELNYSYSHAKIDTVLAERDLFPNAEAYVKISLSPSHAIYDICDAMAGTYKAEFAPIPPFHPNCFTGDTLAFARNVSTKFISRYDGDIINITTSKGSRLSITPNHPVLSSNGFVVANELKKGDYLIGTGRRFEKLVGIQPDSKTVKAPIKDIVVPDSVVFSAMPSSVDFSSNNSFYKKVEVILSNRKLFDNLKSSTSKFFNKFNFIGGLVRFVYLVVFSSFDKFLLSSLLATNSIVSLLRKHRAKKGIHFIDRLLSFAITSYLHIISQENLPDFFPADFKFLMKRKLRDTSVIFADKIVSIETSHFKGNVYNLETESHWYSANSIIAHNCTCRSDTFLKPADTFGRVTTLESQINKYNNFDDKSRTVKKIETATKVINLK